MNPPEGLPPYPPVPEGCDRWEYRGMGWKAHAASTFAYLHPGLQWFTASNQWPEGIHETHYLEAVRAEPACQTCKGHGFIPAWTPSYRDPDNNAGAPDTVECPDCAEPELSATLSEPQIESSPTPETLETANPFKWSFCPECRSPRHHHFYGYAETHRYCLDCNQEWHTDLDYLKLARGRSDKHERERDALKAENGRLRAALAEASANFGRIQGIRWGNDGDCGALLLAMRGEDICDDALAGK